MYARWFRPHPVVGSLLIYSDAAAHHIMSDLSALMGDDNPGNYRILAAVDLSNVYGLLRTIPLSEISPTSVGVFGRFDALGLELVGPEHPTGVWRTLRRERSARAPRTFPHTTRPGARRPPPRTNWTTFSRRGGFTGMCKRYCNCSGLQGSEELSAGE